MSTRRSETITDQYSSRFADHRHPNPNKTKLGLRRHTLELDPERASVVRRIFEAYLYGHRSLSAIAAQLNADLKGNPPPVASDPARSKGTWTHQMVWGILHNPNTPDFRLDEVGHRPQVGVDGGIIGRVGAIVDLLGRTCLR